MILAKWYCTSEIVLMHVTPFYVKICVKCNFHFCWSFFGFVADKQKWIYRHFYTISTDTFISKEQHTVQCCCSPWEITKNFLESILVQLGIVILLPHANSINGMRFWLKGTKNQIHSKKKSFLPEHLFHTGCIVFQWLEDFYQKQACNFIQNQWFQKLEQSNRNFYEKKSTTTQLSWNVSC